MRKIGQYMLGKRLKFKEGFQKKFLQEIKHKSGLSWSKLAIQFDISLPTLKGDMYNEKSTLPYDFAKKMIELYPFDSFEKINADWVEAVLEERWGQKKAGAKSLKKISIPNKGESFAELLGVILGDGHVNYKGLRIVGNAFERNHHEYVSKIIKRLFGLDSRLYFSYKGDNSTILNIYSKEIVKVLNANGLNVGRKIINGSRFPTWIYSDKSFIYAALRGLFDTDGGIYLKQKNYSRAFIEFQTHSKFIRHDIYSLLIKTGFSPSKSLFNIRIQRQDQVLRFLRIVGSSNPKNIVRAKSFIQKGIIPLKDNLIKDILNYKEELPYKLQP